MKLVRNSAGKLLKSSVTGALCSSCCTGEHWLADGVSIPNRSPYTNQLAPSGGFYWLFADNGNSDGIYYVSARKYAADNTTVLWAFGGFEKVGDGPGVYVNPHPEMNGAPAQIELVAGQ